MNSVVELRPHGPAIAIRSRRIPLQPAVDIFSAGFNGALSRPPRCRVRSLPLTGSTRVRKPWRLGFPQVATLGITFPDPLLVTHDKAPDERRQAITPSPGHQRSATATTRVAVPPESLSVKDRLFYILQPPLESLLSGHELRMPFEPFPFQYDGIAWLFGRSTAMLADEMGLGKTMQAITAARLLMRSGQVNSVLVVCPKPLIPNWQREFAMWAEELPAITISGNAARRRMLWTMPGIPLRIANYELLARDFEMLGADALPAFDLVILDEAQRIKNRDSRTAQAARRIPRHRSWALTGTPIENRTEELASLFEFLRIVPRGGTPSIRRLSRLAGEYVLRRTKNLVLTDLPPRLDRDESIELSPAQEHAYRTAERDGVIQLNDLGDSITIQHVFELILRLKQIANFDPLTGESTKFERLAAELDEIAASGSKAILFSQWTGCLNWLNERLQPFGPLIFHGGVPSGRREAVLERFRDDDDAHILLMSYGVGSVGLNLQMASYVFLFDRWWNPAVEDQAINRAHRIGQTNPVTVTRFICRDTIEERIDRILRSKRQLFEAVLGEIDDAGARLSMNSEEIFGLFDLKKVGQDASLTGQA